MKKIKQQLYELLTIQAPSGQEQKVVDYLQPVLSELMDVVFTDDYGNLLGEMKVGTGDGATILLSAHMDTVRNIQKDREVYFNDKKGTFHSSKGVLGADDRAGIAIILAVLRNIHLSKFDGTIKVAFSREEEIGCVGANHIDPIWYDDSSLAIVVDRRGSRDIVTGCGEMFGFCSEEVGVFFEEIGGMLDMNWEAVPGGLSDADVFSSNGVHSVNLSAGYYNEHTAQEYLVLGHCKDTVNLILQALNQVNMFVHAFGEVPSSNRGFATPWWELENERDNELGEIMFYDGYDPLGSVSGSTICGYVSLIQDKTTNTSQQEIFMNEKNFQKLLDQYCVITGYVPGTQLEKMKMVRGA